MSGLNVLPTRDEVFKEHVRQAKAKWAEGNTVVRKRYAQEGITLPEYSWDEVVDELVQFACPECGHSTLDHSWLQAYPDCLRTANVNEPYEDTINNPTATACPCTASLWRAVVSEYGDIPDAEARGYNALFEGLAEEALNEIAQTP